MGSARHTDAQDPVVTKHDPRARAYAQARRHSARVRFYKRVIPISTAGAVVLLLAYAMSGPTQVGGLTLGPLNLSGTKITMERPRLTGFRTEGQPYEVTATSATQDVRKPHVVELQELKGRMVVDENGETARLEAVAGVFDSQKEHLTLQHDVRVTTDSGHEARLKSASIDFKAGTLMSRDPVTVKLTNGVVESDGLEIGDRGKVISFVGRVRTVFESASEPAQAPAAAVPDGAIRAVQATPAGTRPASVRP
jgi:lipopolysaccharide export system protein LptC